VPNPVPMRTTPEQERIAQQNGYPSYEAMIMFERQRMRNRNNGSQVAGAQIRGATPQQQPAPNPKVQSMMSWHPAVIFRRISEALRGANEK
jgi:hypothetical protein